MKKISFLLISVASCFAGWQGPFNIFTAQQSLYPAIALKGDGVILMATVSPNEQISYLTAFHVLVNQGIGGWQLFSPAGVPVLQSSVVMPTASDALIGWFETDVTTGNVFARGAVLTNNAWSPATNLSDPTTYSATIGSTGPGLSLSSLSGKGIAAWLAQESTGSTFQVQNAVYNQSWQPTSVVASSDNYLSGFSAAGADTGLQIAAWFERSPLTLQVAYYNVVDWAQEQLSTDVYQSCSPHVSTAISSHGRALVLWQNASAQGLSAFDVISQAIVSIYTPPVGVSLQSFDVAMNNTGAMAIFIVRNGNLGSSTLLASHYNTHTWSTPTAIAMVGTGNSMSSPSIAYDAAGNACAVWQQNNTVYAALYDADTSSWEPAQQLSAPGVTTRQPTVSMESNGRIMVAWSADISNVQTIQISYQGFGTLPTPARNIIGQTVPNQFLFQTDLVNILNWSASSQAGIVSYNLFRNDEKIAIIPAEGPYTYEDHNRVPGQHYTYAVTAVDGQGTESLPITFSLYYPSGKTASKRSLGKDRHA